MANWFSTVGCLCCLWISIAVTGCGGGDSNSSQPSSSSSNSPSSTSNSPTSPGFGPGGPGTSPGTFPSTGPSGPPAGSQLPGSTIPTTGASGPSSGSQLPGSTIPTTGPSGPPSGSQLPGSTFPTTGPSGPPAGSQLTPVMMASTQRSTGAVRQILLADDSTGDIYIRGDFVSYQGAVANELIRLHADGSVVNRFGQGFDGHIYRIALAKTSDGELYVSGAFTHFNGQPVSHLVRLTRTGALDPAFRFVADFDPGGIAVADDGTGDVYSVYSGPNLDCVRESQSTAQCAYALQIARLNPDGSVDPSFSTAHGFPGGFPSNANPAWIQAVLPMSNGKLSVGGSLLSYNGVDVSSLVRLNMNGTLDTTFVDNVGYTSDPVVETIAPAGLGTQNIYIGGRIGVFRILETGAFDTSFTAAVPMITFAIAPVQDGTGDLYASGLADNRIRLLRFNRNGAVVATFQEPVLDAEVLTIVPLPDGTRDLYIGGAFTTYNGVSVNRIARLHADGTLASILSGR
jgi:hypothetical protein